MFSPTTDVKERLNLEIKNVQEIFIKDSSSLSSLSEPESNEKLTNIQNFDINLSELSENDFDEYISTFDYRRPPEIFLNLLEFYKNNYGIFDKTNNCYIFPGDRLIILIAIFFGGEAKISNRISLDLCVKPDILNDIGCECMKPASANEKKYQVKKINIGNVVLNYLNTGIVYNILIKKYNISLKEISSIRSKDVEELVGA